MMAFTLRNCSAFATELPQIFVILIIGEVSLCVEFKGEGYPAP